MNGSVARRELAFGGQTLRAQSQALPASPAKAEPAEVKDELSVIDLFNCPVFIRPTRSNVV